MAIKRKLKRLYLEFTTKNIFLYNAYKEFEDSELINYYFAYKNKRESLKALITTIDFDEYDKSNRLLNDFILPEMWVRGIKPN